MSIPLPNLDDRSFQDLVDDAKRHVRATNPGWTDHNLSDPGVTLIEAFAQMVDQLIYRVNRIPELHHLRLLQLLGIKLRPPSATTVDVTFELAKAQPDTVSIPAGTEVASRATEEGSGVVFATVNDLRIPSVDIAHVATPGAGGDGVGAAEDVTRRVNGRTAGSEGVHIFRERPQVGDELLIGLNTTASGCLVRLQFEVRPHTGSIDTFNPPWVWSVITAGSRLVELGPADVADGTAGFTRSGTIDLHLPEAQQMSTRELESGEEGRRRTSSPSAAWLICRCTENFDISPVILSVSADAMGVTGRCENIESIGQQALGTSDGRPGQRFAIGRSPIAVSRSEPVLEVGTPGVDGEIGWEAWQLVEHFGDCGPDDRVWALDQTLGEVSFGPEVRDRDGQRRRFGAAAPRGAQLRVRGLEVIGESGAVIPAGGVSVKRGSLRQVARVYNRRPSTRGEPAETVDEAKERVPILLRARDRAVTARDFEALARQAAPEWVARAHCREAAAGLVQLALVPRMGHERLEPDHFELPPEARQAVVAYLEERRLLGQRVDVGTVSPKELSVLVEAQCEGGRSRAQHEAGIEAALRNHLHPTRGGNGQGWSFGRPITADELRAVLTLTPGVLAVTRLEVYEAAETADTRRIVERIDIELDQLPLLREVEVSVDRR